MCILYVRRVCIKDTMKPYSPVGIYQRFIRTSCFHLQGRNKYYYYFTLKMAGSCFSEVLVNIFHTIYHHIRQNFKPHKKCTALRIHVYCCPTSELQLSVCCDVVMTLKHTSGQTG